MDAYYESKGITIYHGDARDVFPWLEPADLILTDPPYGVECHIRHQPNAKDYRPMAGDQDSILAAWILSKVGDTDAVIWGANNWPNLLPHKGRWTCWDKRCDERADRMLGSAFELAWENRRSGFDQMVRIQHGGVVNADRSRFGRNHPTQKPVALSLSILQRYQEAKLIVDPFAGSGTTLRAAYELGRKAIGIEIEERYCELMANRLRQKVLF